MKKSIVFILLIGLFVGCEKQLQDETPIPEVTTESESSLKIIAPCTVDLILKNYDVVGTVTSTLNDDFDEITITYEITDLNYCMKETNLDVQADPSNFPVGNNGNPKPNLYAYGATFQCGTLWSQVVDLTTINGYVIGDRIYIAAATLVKDTKPEYAWGEGTSFPGPKFGMYFYCNPPPCLGISSFDYGGQTYTTVEIGEQCWMKENLNIGTRIVALNNDQTNNGTIEKYCYDDDENNCDLYGGLYQWNEMMQYTTQEGAQGICPAGWHVPTDTDWKVLEGTVDCCYGVGNPEWDGTGFRGYDAGYRLKTTYGWSKWNGNDLFGFSALPGGYYRGHFYGVFSGKTYYGFWWTSTSEYYYPEVCRGGRDLSYFYNGIRRYQRSKHKGHSVRCIKD